MRKARKRFFERGNACDDCGAELFDYPVHRLCAECEELLDRPERWCPKCGRRTRSEGVCLECKIRPPAFTLGVSAFVYRGEVSRLLNRIKRGNARLTAYFGAELGKRFLEVVPSLTEEELLVVAIPLSRRKKRVRGFNQALRITENVYEYLSSQGRAVRLEYSLIKQTKETKPQKEMTRKEREDNVKGAYRITNREAVKGRTVLLVDDVMTTGATGSECARKLLSAGAKEVYLLTIAALPEKG